MTRKEAIRQTDQQNVLMSLGFTMMQVEQLRRISMTLHRWSERECNGEIERAGDDGDGVPYVSHAAHGGKHLAYRIPDRERGALARLAQIVVDCNRRRRENGPDPDDTRTNALAFYHQGDPRGAALYILRPGDVPEGQDAGSYYTRGICVY